MIGASEILIYVQIRKTLNCLRVVSGSVSFFSGPKWLETV